MDTDTAAPDEPFHVLLGTASLPAWVVDEQTLRFLVLAVNPGRWYEDGRGRP